MANLLSLDLSTVLLNQQATFFAWFLFNFIQFEIHWEDSTHFTSHLGEQSIESSQKLKRFFLFSSLTCLPVSLFNELTFQLIQPASCRTAVEIRSLWLHLREGLLNQQQKRVLMDNPSTHMYSEVLTVSLKMFPIVNGLQSTWYIQFRMSSTLPSNLPHNDWLRQPESFTEPFKVSSWKFQPSMKIRWMAKC